MLVFANLDKHSFVGYEKGKIFSIRKRDILDKKIKIDNLQIINGKLLGKRFDIYKLPEIKTESSKVMIIKVKFTPDGKDIIGYYYIDTFGKIRFANKDDLRTFRKLSVLNGTIDRGMMIVSNMEVLETERMYKSVSYDIDEYFDMFRLYKNKDLMTNDHKSVSSTTECFGRQQEYSASPFENFTNYHKQIYDLILKSEVLRVVKIYENNKIVDNVVEGNSDKEDFFYVVTFNYFGNTKSVVIHSKDKRMIRLINFKGTRLSKTSLDDIKNIIIDNESSDSTISGKSLVEQVDIEKELDKINNGLVLTKNIEVNSGKIKLVTGEFKIRRNILIGSSDFRLMLAA